MNKKELIEGLNKQNANADIIKFADVNFDLALQYLGGDFMVLVNSNQDNPIISLRWENHEKSVSLVSSLTDSLLTLSNKTVLDAEHHYELEGTHFQQAKEFLGL